MLFWLLLVVVGALTTSCVDNSYDFGDIDLTLGSDVNLTLPTCSTGDIELRNFLNHEDDGVVSLVWDEQRGDSVFCIKQSGEAKIDPVHIGEIRITRPTVEPFDAWPKRRAEAASSPRRRMPLSTEWGAVDLPGETFRYDIKDKDVVEYSINDSHASDVSADVVSLERVRIKDVAATLSIHFDVPAYLTHLHLDALTLHMPAGLQAKSVTYQGETTPVSDEDNARGCLQLSPDVDARGFDPHRGLALTVVFSGAKIGGGVQFDARRHVISLAGSFRATGSIRLETDELDFSAIPTAALQQLVESKDFGALLPHELHIHGGASFQEDMVVSHITGDVVHEVDDLDPILLDDMPDFLNDPDVVLDLDNPVVFVRAQNQMNAEATTQLTLRSEYSDSSASVVRQTEPLTIHGAGRPTLYYLADKPATFFPEGMAEATYTHVAGLGALIKRIPRQIDVDVAPVQLHCEDLDVLRPYDLQVSYDVFAPLEAGPEFQLVYRESERGWIADGGMDDLDKVNAEGITLTADAVSNVPADVIFTLIPLDAYGQEIKQLLVDKVRIEREKTSRVEIGIRPEEGHTINDALAGRGGVKQLDGITYEARINEPAEGKAFTRQARVRLSNIKVSVKGKVSYDAN